VLGSSVEWVAPIRGSSTPESIVVNVTQAQATAGAKAQRKSINMTNFGAGAMQQASREYGVDLWQKLAAWTRRLNRYLNQARQGHFPAAVHAAKPGGGLRPFQPHVLVVSKMAPKAFWTFLQ
jgi:hypothetical protein